MLDKKITPKVITFRMLIKGYCRQTSLGKASFFLLEMKERKINVVIKTKP